MSDAIECTTSGKSGCPLVHVDNVSVKQLEFWPEYGAGPLWAEGVGVDPTQLGLPTELVERLVAWNARYGDERRRWKAPVTLIGSGRDVDCWPKPGLRWRRLIASL